VFYRSAVRGAQPLGLLTLTLTLSFMAAHGLKFFGCCCIPEGVIKKRLEH
jgi:hypothetical protein